MKLKTTLPNQMNVSQTSRFLSFLVVLIANENFASNSKDIKIQDPNDTLILTSLKRLLSSEVYIN